MSRKSLKGLYVFLDLGPNTVTYNFWYVLAFSEVRFLMTFLRTKYYRKN